jgi:hypothetical protein
MLLSWLDDDDVTSEHGNHGHFADAVAIAACLLAALIVHYHTLRERPSPYSVARASHSMTLSHPTHMRRA